jgi:hypothetical protein
VLLEFPAPGGMYMSRRDSYICCLDFPVLCEDGGIDTIYSSKTRLEEEEDNVIEEIDSEGESDEAEEVVVPEMEDTVDEVEPETQESLQVAVFETQPQYDVANQPRDVDIAAGHKYGGFHQPTESEGDDYSSYSQLSTRLRLLPLWKQNCHLSVPNLYLWS